MDSNSAPHLQEFMRYADGEAAALRASLTARHDYADLAIAFWHTLDTPKMITLTDEKAVLFTVYKAQVDNACCLVIMSTLRLHYTPALTNMRHAVEHICLAAYALCQPDEVIKSYGAKGFEKRVAAQRALKTKAYAWLETNHRDFNDYLKGLKDNVINRYGSHASMAQLANATKVDSGDISLSFFDGESDPLEVGILILLSDLMDQFSKFILANYAGNGVELKSGVVEALQKHASRLAELKAKARHFFPRDLSGGATN